MKANRAVSTLLCLYAFVVWICFFYDALFIHSLLSFRLTVGVYVLDYLSSHSNTPESDILVNSDDSVHFTLHDFDRFKMGVSLFNHKNLKVVYHYCEVR